MTIRLLFPQFSLQTFILAIIVIAFAFGTVRFTGDYLRYRAWLEEHELVRQVEADYLRYKQLQEPIESENYLVSIERRLAKSYGRISMMEYDRLTALVTAEKMRLDIRRHQLESERSLLRSQRAHWLLFILNLPHDTRTSCTPERKRLQLEHVMGDDR